jgi:UDP-N-acetylglucosamine 1-carboxyvinyltransferase
MDKLYVTGGQVLKGEVAISKAKNAYLPIMTATLLSSEKITLKEVPLLKDIDTTCELLKRLGAQVERQGKDVMVWAKELTSLEATYDLVKTMRASILVLGPLLARYKKAKVSLPGGCAIGARPIDIHLSNLEKMGAVINLHAGNVEATTTGLKGAHLLLSFPSVGATENLMMAAALAQGTTVIENAAQEPEIEDLANFIIALGAKVEGAGTAVVTIHGAKKITGTTYTAIGDRVEAATFLMAALATRGEVKAMGIKPQYLDAVLVTLRDMGAQIDTGPDWIKAKWVTPLKSCKIATAPFPGFPTDVQAQLMALCSLAKGTSIITEAIFENRFMHVPELQRLGANISLEGNVAIIEGVEKLSAAPVMCTDLRASAALVLASLAAVGKSEIQRIYHLDRGYEQLHLKFAKLGAQIERIK